MPFPSLHRPSPIQIDRTCGKTRASPGQTYRKRKTDIVKRNCRGDCLQLWPIFGVGLRVRDKSMKCPYLNGRCASFDMTILALRTEAALSVLGELPAQRLRSGRHASVWLERMREMRRWAPRESGTHNRACRLARGSHKTVPSVLRYHSQETASDACIGTSIP